jgi:hypothetical protein
MSGMPFKNAYGSGEAAAMSASDMVRRLDTALLMGGLVFSASFAATMFVLWLPAFGSPNMGRAEALTHCLQSLSYAIPGSKADWLPWAELKREPGVILRVCVSLLLAASTGGAVFRAAAKPRSRVRHIDGPELKRGKEAHKACATQSQAKGPPWMALHPWLKLCKKHWNKHVLITGSVGSGKTVILSGFVRQLFDAGKHGRKLLLHDIKGDWTRAYADRAILISPWDKRSRGWNISADITTPQAAATLAQSLIPSKDGEFWGPAAQSIVIGVIHELMHDRQHLGQDWGWRTLADRLTLDAEELRAILAAHYPQALRLLQDPTSNTALNVLQTISAHTRIIEQLAVAWGNGEGCKGFSLVDWASDSYRGRRQVIVAAGPDRELTARYIGAMVNTLVPLITTPALPDDEEIRTIAIVLDEFTSIGKITDIGRLIEMGRSKSCFLVLGYQNQAQIKEIYGPNFSEALPSMVGTQIICQLGMGETANTVANLFGRRRVTLTTHSFSAGSTGASSAQHEEMRQVVTPSDLTSGLGVIKHRRFAMGFGIRAIVSIGGDPLLLEFPGEVLEKKFPAFVPAKWTKGVPARSGAVIPPMQGATGGHERKLEMEGSRVPEPEPEIDAFEAEIARIQDGR